jgi:hypothetical protein
MEDERDILLPALLPPAAAHTDNNWMENMEEIDNQVFDPSTLDLSCVPLYAELKAVRSVHDITREVVASYSSFLANVPRLDCPCAEEMNIEPIFAAPFVSEAMAQMLPRSALLDGIRINIPRSSKLWTGDHLKLRWGNTTYYSVIGEPKGRKGPRETRCLSGAHLGRSKNGLVEVSYEVLRRSKLVGISEPLILMLTSDHSPCPTSPDRTRAIRRRKRLQ